MKGIDRFNLVKERYEKAYRDNNGKEIEVYYEKGFVRKCKDDDGFKVRISQFEKMTETLENRLLDESINNK